MAKTLICWLVIVFIIPFATAAPNTPALQQERYENLELFQKVLHFVEENYVDKDKVKNKDLIYGSIKGMLDALDPHSNFLPPDIFKDMKIDTTGKFGGLGIEIGMKDNILTVISPIEDTPAWKAGIKPGDRILKINGESTKGLSLVEAVAKMRGKKDTEVKLSIYRDGFEKPKEVKLMRDMIKIQSIKYEMLDNGYGYMRVSSFNENTTSDAKKVLAKLEKEEKLRGLVLDMRWNPGGLLDQAVDLTSLFIDEGIVVSTIGRDPAKKEVRIAKKGNARKDLPLVVVVNSSTASAAEIVAGALQDHHRAIVTGQPTFGKGSVQTVLELTPEVGLKLTIARYYTPSGRSIQDRGVIPDILLDDYDPKLLAQAKKKSLDSMREKDLKGHLINEQAGREFSLEELDNPKKKPKEATKKDNTDDDDMAPIKFAPKEDYQVQMALSYLKSNEVFRKLGTKPEATEPTPAPKK